MKSINKDTAGGSREGDGLACWEGGWGLACWEGGWGLACCKGGWGLASAHPAHFFVLCYANIRPRAVFWVKRNGSKRNLTERNQILKKNNLSGVGGGLGWISFKLFLFRSGDIPPTVCPNRKKVNKSAFNFPFYIIHNH